MQMQVSDSVERPVKSQKPVFLACSSVSQQLEQKYASHIRSFHIFTGENVAEFSFILISLLQYSAKM